MTSPNTKSVWQDILRPTYDRLKAPGRFDVAVVGGGITGLTAAYLLKQAGKTVCVLERDRLGGGDTGHTTAHLTCVTDTRLTELAKTFGREQAALAWYAGFAAIDLIERIVTDNDIACEFRRVPSFLHAALYGQRDETEDLREESELARDLGFDVDFVQRVPIVDKPGMRVRDQAKFHPLAYLAALAKLIQGDGSAIHEQSEVTEVHDEPLAVVANDARIECDYLVVATHVPIMGKTGLLKASLLQSKLAPYSSYVVSGRLPPRTAPDLSLWDTSDPYYYLRVDTEAGFERVIFGGNDHKTGQAHDTGQRYRQLEETLRQILPSVEMDHRWSGQVIHTNDGLPFIGEISQRQFVATGFNGNGITFGTLAGVLARDAMLKRDNPWQTLFAVDRTKFRGGTWDYIKENLDYPYYMIADWLNSPKKTEPADIAPGSGQVLKIDGARVACSRDEQGTLHQVSAVCTHLGCLVRWNGAEKTWDCPCHGSRFQPNGEVLAGPAESPLEPVQVAASAK